MEEKAKDGMNAEGLFAFLDELAGPATKLSMARQLPARSVHCPSCGRTAYALQESYEMDPADSAWAARIPAYQCLECSKLFLTRELEHTGGPEPEPVTWAPRKEPN